MLAGIYSNNKIFNISNSDTHKTDKKPAFNAASLIFGSTYRTSMAKAMNDSLNQARDNFNNFFNSSLKSIDNSINKIYSNKNVAASITNTTNKIPSNNTNNSKKINTSTPKNTSNKNLSNSLDSFTKNYNSLIDKIKSQSNKSFKPILNKLNATIEENKSSLNKLNITINEDGKLNYFGFNNKTKINSSTQTSMNELSKQDNAINEIKKNY